MVTVGSFREGLLYRLNEVPLKMPPLRERAEDITLLVDHFLKKLAIKGNRNRLTFSPEALAKLQRHSWPGNVRELQHVLGIMVALAKSDRLEAAEVPEPAAPRESGTLLSLNMSGVEGVNMGSVLEGLEARLIQWALDRAEGNPVKAGEMLGLPRSTLEYKINKGHP
jgi:DNA-binding NtrC family response regulator